MGALGYSQAVRHQTLTLAFRWFKSSYPSPTGTSCTIVQDVLFSKAKNVPLKKTALALGEETVTSSAI